MPKGRGCKGTKAPSKRRPTVPVKSRFELNPSTDLPGPGVLTLPFLLHPPTLLARYRLEPLQLRLLVAQMNPCSLCLHLCLHGLLSLAIQPTPQVEVYTPLESTSFQETFQFAMGAKADTRLAPPYDTCLQHEEWHTFISPGSSTPQSRFGNVYYHCNIHCVKAVWHHFLPSSVVIPSSVSVCLHQSFLYVNFAI